MLYTRNGDNGTSGLWGSAERFPKDSPVYEALGSLDELCSMLGVCRAKAGQLPEPNAFDVAGIVLDTQETLFILQAQIAGADKALSGGHIAKLEETIQLLEYHIPPPDSFIIPGCCELSGLLDYARALARRAERAVIHARPTRELPASAYAYLNRLSSLLYALARYVACDLGEDEASPSYALSKEIGVTAQKVS